MLGFNLQLDSNSRLKNVQLYKEVLINGIPYAVWVFKSGTFVNKGDGGYINWAFRGRFRRVGASKVIFSPLRRS